MFSFCKIGGLARVFCSALQLDTRQRQVGRFDTQPQPTWEVCTPEGRFLGGIEGFGTFSWRDLKFGTRRRAKLEVWYPQKPSGQIATRHFSERREPNRQSWQKSGYQTSSFAKIWAGNRTGGTKPPTLADGTQMKRGRPAVLLPREGGYGGADYGEGGAHEDDPA